MTWRWKLSGNNVFDVNHGLIPVVRTKISNYDLIAVVMEINNKKSTGDLLINKDRVNFFFPDENLFFPDAKKMSLFPRCQNFIESLYFPDDKKMSLFPRGQNSLTLVFFLVFVVNSSHQSLKRNKAN